MGANRTKLADLDMDFEHKRALAYTYRSRTYAELAIKINCTISKVKREIVPIWEARKWVTKIYTSDRRLLVKLNTDEVEL